MTNPDVHVECPMARHLEQQTAKIPSDLFLSAAVGSIVASPVLKVTNKNHDSTFIRTMGTYPFCFLGIYNKLVKQYGSDRLDHRVGT